MAKGNGQWAKDKMQKAIYNQSRLVKGYRNPAANWGGKGRVKQIIDQHETLGHTSASGGLRGGSVE